MRRALQEAQAAYEEGEIPIGAVVVCQDHIIARAHNLTETLHDVTAHAEMQAITASASRRKPWTSACTTTWTADATASSSGPRTSAACSRKRP